MVKKISGLVKLLVGVCIVIISLTNWCLAAQITLQWDPVNNANLAGYRLYWRSEGTDYDYQDPLWEGRTIQCHLNQLEDNKVYYFVVHAVDTNGIESGDSNEARYPADSAPDNSLSGSGSGGSGGSAGCFIESIF